VIRRVEDIHHDLRRWITEKTILVGHSFESDLKALKLIHHRVIDTAVLFSHHHGKRKYSLKHLAKLFLERKIQNGDGIYGHDPVEDAIAALDLMILKVKNGPSFGVHLTGNHSLVNILCKHHKKIRVFGSRTVTVRFSCNQGNSTTVTMNDPELVGKVSKVFNNPNVDLIQVQLTRGSGTGERVSKIINSIWESVLPQTLVIILTGRHCLKRLKIL